MPYAAASDMGRIIYEKLIEEASQRSGETAGLFDGKDVDAYSGPSVIIVSLVYFYALNIF